MELVSVRFAAHVDPGAFVETYGIDNERVAFPTTNRMPHPRETQRVSLGMLTAIHINDAPHMSTAFVNHHNALLFRQLNDLHWIWSGHHARPSRRQAETLRI